MLVADIARRVREAAGDMGELQFSNSTLADWINDGIRECVRDNNLLEGTGTTASVVGQMEYTLPADIFKLHSVYYDGDKLPIYTLGEFEDRMGHSGEKGVPFIAAIYAGKLRLAPTPEVAGKVITINYTKNPANIAWDTGGNAWAPTTLTGILPEPFHPRIVVYCLAQVAMQDDDMEKYNLLMQMFKADVIDLGDLKNHTENYYPSISYTDWDTY